MASLRINTKLSNLLEKIKDESEIARLLLSDDIPDEMLIENNIDYLSISNDDIYKISYLTKERLERIDFFEIWESSKRYHAKPGSIVSKIFKSFDNREIENFSNLFKSVSQNCSPVFRVVSGYDIVKYYNEYQYYPKQGGTIWTSCMRYGNCQDYLEIYAKSKIVKMLIMVDPGSEKILGRALLWHLDNYKIMDRIYTCDDNIYVFPFKEWATERGYLYKSHQTWSETHTFENLLTPKRKLYLEVEMDNFREYPYVDTFKFIDLKTGNLFNYKPFEDDRRLGSLCSLEGCILPGSYLQLDRNSGRYVKLEDMEREEEYDEDDDYNYIRYIVD
jgi:hypothetical protein